MRLVHIGLALFAIGLVFIAIDVLPFFLGDHNSPLWLNLACLAAPAGFAIAIATALHDGRDAQRQALREIEHRKIENRDIEV
jgi:peptidoglycan/LPS O-acetylase OafA/YrhL